MTIPELWTPQTGKVFDETTPTPQELFKLFDDAQHNINAFVAWQNETSLDITTFMPIYDDNGGVKQKTYYPTPFDAFIAANRTLMSKGVIS